MNLVIMVIHCYNILEKDNQNFVNFLVDIAEQTNKCKVLINPNTPVVIPIDNYRLNTKMMQLTVEPLPLQDAIQMIYNLNKENKEFLNHYQTPEDLAKENLFSDQDQNFTPKKLI
jgi:hypothetical protein